MIRNQTQAKAATTPGLYPAGPNLVLKVNPPGKADAAAGKPHGSRMWMVRWKADGKVKTAKLDDLDALPHSTAVRRAAQRMEAIRSGEAPSAPTQSSPASVTFGEASAAYLAAHNWTGKHPADVRMWHRILQDICAPIRATPLDEVSPQQVGDLIAEINRDRAATAKKIPPRIREVFDFMGRATCPLDDAGLRRRLVLLARQRPDEEHHDSMPYSEAPAFVAGAWAARGKVSARALLFLILTCVRRENAGAARWEHIDLDAAVWTIPKGVMKFKKEGHTVPLSRQAVALLREVERPAGFVFPAHLAQATGEDSHINLESMRAWMKHNGGADYTPHGFRTTFRTWVLNETEFQGEIAEIALHHQPGKVEGVYKKSDALERRRALMQAFADFVLPDGGA